MKPLEGFREKLYKEMLARIKETDESVPYRRTATGTTSARRGPAVPDLLPPQGPMDAPEEILLDVNELAKGQKFTVASAPSR